MHSNCLPAWPSLRSAHLRPRAASPLRRRCPHPYAGAAAATAALGVDCKAPNPEWASINLGIMVCLECSGLHRQMGTHISKVRSLKLDAKCWVGALLAHMCSLGNTAFNAVWEANLPPDAIQPQYYPEHNAVRVGGRVCRACA